MLLLFVHVGLGRILLVDTLRTVRPDVVIQIVCTSQGRNLPSMDAELVARDPGWMTSAVRTTAAVDAACDHKA